MEQRKEEKEEKLFIKISELNAKIFKLVKKKTTIDNQIYMLAKKRDKILFRIRKIVK